MEILRKFKQLADENGFSMTHLALAWVLKNTDVTSALTGTTKKDQLIDSVKALEVLDKYSYNIEEQIESIFQNEPLPDVNVGFMARPETRRKTVVRCD